MYFFIFKKPLIDGLTHLVQLTLHFADQPGIIRLLSHIHILFEPFFQTKNFRESAFGARVEATVSEIVEDLFVAIMSEPVEQECQEAQNRT